MSNTETAATPDPSGTPAGATTLAADADVYKVVATDRISESGLEPLLEDDRFQVVQAAGWDQADVDEALRDAHGVIIRSGTQVTADFLEKAPNLQVIGRAGVGVDNIDLEQATSRGIAVLNAPAGNTISAAELTMALLLSAVRKVPMADQSLREGRWDRKSFGGKELRGKTLGLVGAGRIGGEVGRRARAFEMKVLAYDPHLPEERAEDLGFELAGFDEVIERADVISLHTPLTSSTKGMIGREQLQRMKSSALLVNVGRGGLVDEDALVEALENEEIAGGALDVYETEPLPEDSPLRKAPNLVLTPHLGASTSEAQERVASEIAHAVRGALLEGDLSRALNAPAIGGEALRKLRPLLDLGGRVGRLAGALARGGIVGVDVRYAGAAAEGTRDPLNPLSASVLTGVLSDILGAEEVNYVNALHLAEGRGIKVATSTQSRHRDYSEYVEAVVETDDGQARIAGALLGERHPRVVSIDGFDIDLPPHGTMVVLRNQDVPGVIGKVGTILGEQGLNIADYRQSRRSPGGEAMAAVTVDGEVTPAVLDALRQVPEVQDAYSADLS